MQQLGGAGGQLGKLHNNCHQSSGTLTVSHVPLPWPLQKALKQRYKTVKFVPFNPVNKFTCATVMDLQTQKCIRLLKGSPQVP